jgi:CubicO group peptidase (beta-lactamase class C family)
MNIIMKKIILLLLVLVSVNGKAQSLYFPPLSGNTWDTLSPVRLQWCQARIDSLYNYLEARNTQAFIILKDGRIVIEKYFGTFTADSIHYWASAGKSLTATLTGIAQQKKLININDSVSKYLGQGWTSAPANKEGLISLKHLINMTSGLDESPKLPCDNEDTARTCLTYKVDAGTRWAYHTGAYRKIQAVFSKVSGQSYTLFTNSVLGSRIGMTGLWYDGVYFSKSRSMARFGLFVLNNGIWANDTILSDTNYYHNMNNTSQNFNLSYGYLWWLNGKASFMAPSSQIVFNAPLFSNAPADMFAALGKNDQKIYIVPSQKMVVVRVGASAYDMAAAFSPFDNELWAYINQLKCDASSGMFNQTPLDKFKLFPNPANQLLYVNSSELPSNIVIQNIQGETLFQIKPETTSSQLDISNLAQGLYLVEITTEKSKFCQKLIINR